jgi:hypothetical protein
MSTTTHRQRKTSTAVSVREVRSRLKTAREQNNALKQAGNLPSPTKSWSRDSMKSLKIALSAKKVCSQ